MFASCGYFRGLTCPYFQSGLCERPYCHFRHVKEKEKETSTTTSNKSVLSVENIGNIISPNLPNDSYFQKAEKKNDENEKIESPHSVEEEDENGGEFDAESMEQKDKIAFPAPNPSFQPVYKPTPKSEITPRNPNDPLPEYCPTPIPELKKLHKTLPINLEYDPVSNFSLKEKKKPSQPTYVPIKRSLSNDSGEFPSMKQMRLDGNVENGDQSEYIVHDEVCDSDEDEASGAQFSDDEENMNDLNECQEETSFDEFFDTKSYARDTVRDKDSESQIPNKLKKFDLVSGILVSGTSENDQSKIEFKKFQKRLSDKENLKMESSRNSKDKSSSRTSSSKPSSIEKVKNSVKSSSSSSSSSKTGSASKSSSSKLLSSKSSSSSSHTSSKSSSHKSSSMTAKSNSHRHSSSDGKEQHKTKSSSGKSENSKLDEKCDKSYSNTQSKDRHCSGSSSSKKGDKSPRSSSNSSISKTNGTSGSKSDRHHSDFLNSSRHSSGDKAKSSSDKHHSSSDKSKSSNDKHHSSSDKSKSSSDKHHSSSDKSKSSSDKHHSSNDKTKSSRSSGDKHHSSSDKHHSSSTKISSKSSHSLSSSKTKHNSGSQSDSSKSKYDNVTNSRSPKSISDDSQPNKRYSIEDIHNDLFGDTEESDNDRESITEEPAAEMPDSEIFQYLDESDFSDADTYEECLKIFNETAGSRSKSPVKKDTKKKPETSTEDSAGKKRMAYEAASKVTKKPVVKAKTILSPAQVMHNRIIAMQKQALEAAAARKAASETPTATAPSASSAITGLFGGSKKRVAHATNDMNTKTQAITASKSEKRQQHTPTIKNMKRPTVPAEYGSKVPTAIRQRYLNLIIDECLKFIKDEETAFKRGQEEEHVAYGRSSNKNIYLRMAVNTIKRLRSEADAKNNSPKKVVANAQSHEATLGGSRAAKTSFTLKRSGAHQTFFGDFSGAELYKRLGKYVTSEEDLQTNNFPRPDSNSSSSAKFYVGSKKAKDPTLKDYEKICNRCGKRFVVYPDCEYGSFEECSFHWGKAWKKKVAGQWETRYTCCSGDLSAIGCAVSKAHTYESNKYENITGYMKTMPTSPPLDGNYGVYAMDCEMVYTTGGMELARVTVVGSDKQPVYETLVKPDYPLIDPNTRYSGIEEKDLDNVKTTLRNVQAVLLSLFNDKTILMGHSLESDLMAVKIIHNTVVDTSLVFPHRLGLPYKRALRNLMSEHLQKIIQNDVGGHDSNEDALACLELMQWRLKEDAKREHRRS